MVIGDTAAGYNAVSVQVSGNAVCGTLAQAGTGLATGDAKRSGGLGGDRAVTTGYHCLADGVDLNWYARLGVAGTHHRLPIVLHVPVLSLSSLLSLSLCKRRHFGDVLSRLCGGWLMECAGIVEVGVWRGWRVWWSGGQWASAPALGVSLSLLCLSITIINVAVCGWGLMPWRGEAAPSA